MEKDGRLVFQRGTETFNHGCPGESLPQLYRSNGQLYAPAQQSQFRFILIGIGLHLEFGPSKSPFTMEIPRRVWWMLFAFVSGMQLIRDRPAVLLVGVNVHPGQRG